MIFSYHALSVTVELLPIIVLALETMTTMTDTSGQAQSLLNNITSSKFIVTITLTSIIIGTTKELCKKLQGETNVRAKTHQQFRRTPTMYEVWGGWLAFSYSMVSGYLKLGLAYMNNWHKCLYLVDIKQSWISCTLLINFYHKPSLTLRTNPRHCPFQHWSWGCETEDQHVSLECRCLPWHLVCPMPRTSWTAGCWNYNAEKMCKTINEEQYSLRRCKGVFQKSHHCPCTRYDARNFTKT